MRLLFVISALTAVFYLYVRFVESRTIFIPSQNIRWTPSDFDLSCEDIYFNTSDGLRLNGWFFKADESAEETATVLYLHGNAGNIGDRLDKIALLRQAGVNIFIIDYRGYGRSEGRPTEEGMYLDAQAAYDYLLTRSDINKKAIVGYGVSLGGAAVIDLALHRDLACVIMESTLTSAKDMAKRIIPFVPSFFIRPKLDNLNKIKDIRSPKLIIHSVDDEMMPFAFGQRLFKAAPQPKNFLQINGSHNDGYQISHEKFVKGIESCLFNLFLLPIKPCD